MRIKLPRSAIIETTRRCNIRCAICPQSLEDLDRGDMEFDLFLRIIRSLPTLKEAGLYGLGEAFLHPQIKEMIFTVKEAGIFTRIFTNGIMIKEGMAEFLVDVGFDNLILSLDAIDQNLLDQIRPGTKFSQIEQNFQLLNDYKRFKNSNKPYLWLNFVGMAENFSQLPEILLFALTLGFERVDVGPFNRYPGLNFNPPDLEDEEVIRTLIEALNISLKTGLKLGLPPLWLEHPRVFSLFKGASLFKQVRYRFFNSFNKRKFLADLPSKIAHRLEILASNGIMDKIKGKTIYKSRLIKMRDCVDPFRSVLFTFKGEVLPCCSPTAEIMGDLRFNEFAEIWFGEKYQELRHTLRSANPLKMCQICRIRGWKYGLPYN